MSVELPVLKITRDDNKTPYDLVELFLKKPAYIKQNDRLSCTLKYSGRFSSPGRYSTSVFSMYYNFEQINTSLTRYVPLTALINTFDMRPSFDGGYNWFVPKPTGYHHANYKDLLYGLLLNKNYFKSVFGDYVFASFMYLYDFGEGDTLFTLVIKKDDVKEFKHNIANNIPLDISKMAFIEKEGFDERTYRGSYLRKVYRKLKSTLGEHGINGIVVDDVNSWIYNDYRKDLMKEVPVFKSFKHRRKFLESCTIQDDIINIVDNPHLGYYAYNLNSCFGED